MTSPLPPPEAQLIAELRAAIVPPLSMREAARRAGFSVATWTQIEQGHRKVAPGVTIHIKGTAEKLARMGIVVGARPEQLTGAGRQDAAVMLEKLLAAGPDPVAQMIETVRNSRDFDERQKRKLIEMLERQER